jgi:MFS family permease
MKSQGITNQQIGLLISIGFITGAIFSSFSAIITDALGRKRTTLIFDLVSWPVSLIIYFFAHNFWMFALAQIINSSVRIVSVSWNLMVIEDADHEQRVAAFNLLNIITIATGIITPVAGILVKLMGVPNAERIFLAIAAVSMTIMMIGRNHFYTETQIGKQIRAKHSRMHIKEQFRKWLCLDTFAMLKTNPELVMILCIFVLFNIYTLIGTYSSLYFAPYLTEVLSLDKSLISILGSINSVFMLAVFIFIVPLVSGFSKVKNMISGVVIQLAATFFLVIMPPKNIFAVAACIAALAVGSGMFRPFNDAIMAECTEGSERANIYSLMNTAISILSAVIGFASGYVYLINPRLLYLVSIIILALCIAAAVILVKMPKVSSNDIP